MVPHSARPESRPKGQNPDHRRGDRFRGIVSATYSVAAVLIRYRPGAPMLKKARLERHRHREPRQDQGRGPEEHIADVGGVKPEGQCTRRTTPGGKQPAKHQADAVPCAGDPPEGFPAPTSRMITLPTISPMAMEISEGEDSLGAVLCIQGGNLSFMPILPPSPSALHRPYRGPAPAPWWSWGPARLRSRPHTSQESGRPSS